MCMNSHWILHACIYFPMCGFFLLQKVLEPTRDWAHLAFTWLCRMYITNVFTALTILSWVSTLLQRWGYSTWPCWGWWAQFPVDPRSVAYQCKTFVVQPKATPKFTCRVSTDTSAENRILFSLLLKMAFVVMTFLFAYMAIQFSVCASSIVCLWTRTSKRGLLVHNLANNGRPPTVPTRAAKSRKW